MQKRLAARGVEFMFNEYIDDIPEAGVVGVTTRSGKRIEDADLVVRVIYVRVDQLITSIYIGICSWRPSKQRLCVFPW